MPEWADRLTVVLEIFQGRPIVVRFVQKSHILHDVGLVYGLYRIKTVFRLTNFDRLDAVGRIIQELDGFKVLLAWVVLEEIRSRAEVHRGHLFVMQRFLLGTAICLDISRRVRLRELDDSLVVFFPFLL